MIQTKRLCLWLLLIQLVIDDPFCHANSREETFSNKTKRQYNSNKERFSTQPFYNPTTTIASKWSGFNNNNQYGQYPITTPLYNGYTTTPRFDNQYNDYTTTPRFNNQYNGYTTTPRFNNQYNGYTTTPRFNNQYNGYTTTPRFNGYTTTPQYNGYTTTPLYNGYTTTPQYNGYTTTPLYNGYTTTPLYNGYTTTPQYNNNRYTTRAPYVEDPFDGYTTTPQYTEYETGAKNTEIITPEEKSYLSCQNEYHSTIVAQMKKYAALKNLPPVTSSKKFHESALFHSKVYAYDDNTNSGFDFFRERIKGISQVILTNDKGSLEDCKSLAIEDINASIGKIEYFWKDPIEIGCAIEASLKSLKTYGICHTYPAIEV